jgi:hypothetical protein
MIPDRRGKSRTTGGNKILNAGREAVARRAGETTNGRKDGRAKQIRRKQDRSVEVFALLWDIKPRRPCAHLPRRRVAAFASCLSALNSKSSAFAGKGLKHRCSDLA